MLGSVEMLVVFSVCRNTCVYASVKDTAIEMLVHMSRLTFASIHSQSGTKFRSVVGCSLMEKCFPKLTDGT